MRNAGSIFRSVASTLLVGAFFAFAAPTFASDSFSSVAPQSATGNGSNGSVIMVGTGGTSADGTATGMVEYVNKDSDQTVFGNYLRGYYYDTQLGFFKLDWSSNPSDNVRFVASTTKCASGYGYALGGYAYGQDGGLIDFDYSSDVSVYYCENDKKLHGYAYSTDAGFQNFEGISLEAWSGGYRANFALGEDPNFLNNSTFLLSSIPPELQATGIQGETQTRSWGVETIFYIVK
ncbi:MAG: hypothetical protein WA194_03590 [Patescibacteria group bacterium]